MVGSSLLLMGGNDFYGLMNMKDMFCNVYGDEGGLGERQRCQIKKRKIKKKKKWQNDRNVEGKKANCEMKEMIRRKYEK